MDFPSVRLKKGRDKSVRRRHPWIFSGALLEEPGPGAAWVQVTDDNGEALAYGLYSPRSQIRVRIWSWDGDAPHAGTMIAERLAAAKQRRAALLKDTDAVRYVNSEGDFLPGVILDKYADTLVLQIQTEGVDRIRDLLIDAIRSVFDEPNLVEKSVGRTEEELPDRTERIYGEGGPGPVLIRNGQARLWVNIQTGHKSGFYLDQRKNISALAEFFDGDQGGTRAGHLLDAFCYSGAFGISLKDRFERVTFVDSSAEALSLCEKNWAENGGDRAAAEFICGDVFRYLRQESIGPFDAGILDPPSFAKRKNEVDGACRGYKDIQRLTMTAIRPGGSMAAFSCSHYIDADLFQKIVFAAAIDADRQAQILSRFGSDLDHPVSIDHPEGEYLKGLLLRII